MLFTEYALRWIDERGLAPTTDELYRRMLRLHLEPTFGPLYVNAISAARVRTWRGERLKATGKTQVAKSYRLLKAIMETAVDDDLIRKNPCRIRGAGREQADERPRCLGRAGLRRGRGDRCAVAADGAARRLRLDEAGRAGRTAVQ
ncbi:MULTISPECIES: hypothetical protein [unclassified Streptomyces]|uniref:hypothetical protein n=1 Tax=unclassified Streptomyces TaxID=2593676 RepID=UPI00386CC022